MPATIIRISQEQLQGATGKLEPMIRVDFKVGDHGPFTEHFPKTGYNPAAVAQSLNTFAQQIEQTQK
jgi:hypothetical protein